MEIPRNSHEVSFWKIVRGWWDVFGRFLKFNIGDCSRV